VRLRVVGTYNSAPWNNIFHLQYTGGAPSVANLNTLCGSFLSAYASNLLPLCNPLVVLASADAQDLTNAGAAQGSATNTSPGTRTGTALPTSACAVISWKINNRYRGGHPRTYVPAGNTADLLLGRNWTDTFVTAANAAANAFLSAINALTTGAITYKLICLSYTRNKIALNPPVPYTIQSGLVDHRLDTQRDRLGKDVAA
jgi:hypothetical protein